LLQELGYAAPGEFAQRSGAPAASWSSCLSCFIS